MADTHYCEDCENMHPDSRSGPSYRAFCMKFPRPNQGGYVTRTKWDKDSPFTLCNRINQVGYCPLFEPLYSGDLSLLATVEED